MILHTLSRLTRAAVVRLTLSLGLVVFAAPLVAQTTEPGSDPGANRALRESIANNYRVLPVRDGIILVPQRSIRGVDNIELRDGTIAVNGTIVTGAELRSRLDRDANAIIQLSYLPLAEQQRLFGLSSVATPGREAGIQERPDQPREPAGDSVGKTERPSEPDDSWSDRRRVRRSGETRVRLGGSVTIAEDEEVIGPVVAIGGSVDVKGQVRDAVVSVGGNVRLGPSSVVRGDVTVVGGRITRDPGAVVEGEMNEIGFDLPSIHIAPLRGDWFPIGPWDSGPWRTFRLFGTLFRVGLIGLLAALIVLVAPRAVERADYAIRTQPFKAALVGLAAQLFFIPLLVVMVVLLLVSIVGIPLLALVPFGILLFFIALLVGFAGAATGAGRLLRDRFNTAPGATLQLLVIGLVGIWGLTLLGRLVGIAGGPLAWVGGAVVVAGFLVEYAAWTLGLGAALLTRMGRYGRLYPMPVAAPIPDAGIPPSDIPPLP